MFKKRRRIPKPVLHPKDQCPRRQVPQPRRAEVLRRTDRGRFDLSAQQLHRKRNHPILESALLLRREDRCRNRRRQPRSGGVPQGGHASTTGPSRGVSKGKQKDLLENSNSNEAANSPITSSTRTRNSSATTGPKRVSETPKWTCGSITTPCAPDRPSTSPSDRPQGQGQDRTDQLHRKRPVQGQTPAPHLQENTPEVHQLLQGRQTQRVRLRGRQGDPHRLLQLEGATETPTSSATRSTRSTKNASGSTSEVSKATNTTSATSRGSGTPSMKPTPCNACSASRRATPTTRNPCTSGSVSAQETNPDEMSVSSLYQNEGYLMSQIEPAETIIGADSIDIEVKVFEGKQFTINNVGISGNQRVDDEVIRRETHTRRARGVQPLAADADHPYARIHGALQPRGHHARHQTRHERTRRHQLAPRRAGLPTSSISPAVGDREPSWDPSASR